MLFEEGWLIEGNALKKAVEIFKDASLLKIET